MRDQAAIYLLQSPQDIFLIKYKFYEANFHLCLIIYERMNAAHSITPTFISAFVESHWAHLLLILPSALHSSASVLPQDLAITNDPT